MRSPAVASRPVIPPIGHATRSLHLRHASAMAAPCCARRNYSELMADFDLAIIGGGINGAGIARDAAGRGLRVLLVEQNDLASGTSSDSTKLIHGGLRYLEARRLPPGARGADRARGAAAHGAAYRPGRCASCCRTTPALRPAWMLRLGLFIYDHLGGREHPARHRARSTSPMMRSACRSSAAFRHGFVYSDCWVDDARLVVLNALDAAERGAVDPHPHALRRAPSARTRTGGSCSMRAGAARVVTARALVNAAGPWVGEVAETVLRCRPPRRVRLVKGSHIVVRAAVRARPRLYLPERRRPRRVRDPLRARLHADRHDRRGFQRRPRQRRPRARPRSPISAAPRALFPHAGRAGARGACLRGRAPALRRRRAPAPKDLTRDYRLDLDARAGAGAAAHRLWRQDHDLPQARRGGARAGSRRTFRARRAWTAMRPLPGGDFPHRRRRGADRARARGLWPFLTEAHARRLVRAYGTRIDRILGEARRRSTISASASAPT